MGEILKANVDLSGFSEKRVDTNLVLIVENTKLWVSKDVLTTYSTTFHNMLHSGFTEKDKSEIELPEENLAEFVTFLRSFIPRPFGVLLNISEDNVRLLMEKAHYYDSPVVMQLCSRFLIDVLAVSKEMSDVRLALRLACLYRLNDVVNASVPRASEAPPDWGYAGLSEMSQSILSYLWYLKKGGSRGAPILQLPDLDATNQLGPCSLKYCKCVNTMGDSENIVKSDKTTFHVVDSCCNPFNINENCRGPGHSIFDMDYGDKIKCKSCEKVLFVGKCFSEPGQHLFCTKCRIFFCASCGIGDHKTICYSSSKMRWF